MIQCDVEELASGLLNFDTVATYDYYLHHWQQYSVYPRFYLATHAPNGKIYTATAVQSNLLHSIENPNVRGIGCNFIQRSVTLPRLNQGGPPNMPNYRLGPLPGNPCDSVMVDMDEPTESTHQLTVVPNPAHDVVKFSNIPEGANTVTIYDEVGQQLDKLVLHPGQDQLTLSLASFHPGVYIYVVSGDPGKVVRGKIVRVDNEE